MTVGTFSLGDLTLTTADTYTGDWSLNHAGATSATFQARFAYGSGGTTTRVFLQTSLDQGTSAIDLCCILFETASEVAILNFSGLTPHLFSNDSPPLPLIPTDGALADDTAVDGILGDRFRIKVVTTGTYGGQTLLSPRITFR